jgi:hypothetical protein
MVREGTDVSIFTYSRMRYVVMQAVAELEKKGYNPEVRRLLLLLLVLFCLIAIPQSWFTCVVGGSVQQSLAAGLPMICWRRRATTQRWGCCC